MASRLNELGELQMAVMNVLWNCPQATVHEVLAALNGERQLAYTTALTALRSLEKRGLVTHDTQENSRTFYYRAVVSAHDARGDILTDVLNRLFAGSPTQLVKHLLETEGFSLKELREIRQALDRQENAIRRQSPS